jgi:hypothetical protein
MANFFGSCHYYALGFKYLYDNRFTWNVYGQTSSKNDALGYNTTVNLPGSCSEVGPNPKLFGNLATFNLQLKYQIGGTYPTNNQWPRSVIGSQNYGSCNAGLTNLSSTDLFIRIVILGMNTIENQRCLAKYPFQVTNLGLLYYNQDTDTFLEVEKMAGGRASNNASSPFSLSLRMTQYQGIWTPNCNCARIGPNNCQEYFGIYDASVTNIYGFLDVGYAGSWQIYAWDSYPKYLLLLLTSPRINSRENNIGNSVNFTRITDGCRQCSLG